MSSSQIVSIWFGSSVLKVSQQVLRIFGIYLSNQGLLSVHRIVKQDQVVAISSLGGFFVIMQILIDSHDREISVMIALRKQLIDSKIFGHHRHEIVQNHKISRPRVN